MMLLVLGVACLLLATRSSEASAGDDQDERIRKAKLDLWLRGAFHMNDLDANNVADLEIQVARAPLRHGPIREVRQRLIHDMNLGDYNSDYSVWDSILNVRGGDGNVQQEDHVYNLDKQLKELSAKFGQPFIDAIAKNKAEHDADCKKSCEIFYCAPDDSISKIQWDQDEYSDTSFKSYSFGSVPPEDFSYEFK